jgi:hypothetical protein
MASWPRVGPTVLDAMIVTGHGQRAALDEHGELVASAWVKSR